MNQSVPIIPFANLALAFLPVLAVIVILWKWQLGYRHSLYAIFRMLAQLLLIGFVLTYIFQTRWAWVIVAALTIMLFSASWIALRTVSIPRRVLYLRSLLSISVGGGITLVLITQGVLSLDPWYMPSYMIPLAGMIFASAMNSVSLAGERLQAEILNGVGYSQARATALQASLIPITNSLLAVGLVSLPGMMTGQILSGVSPFIAVRYQIMVMCMIFASSGISAAVFLAMVKTEFNPPASDNL
jgi:putative ABC transport system permease protein